MHGSYIQAIRFRCRRNTREDYASCCQKVDEFLNEANKCSNRIAALGYIAGLIPGGSILKFIGYIGTAFDIIARVQGWAKGANAIFAGCYFALKRKYAEEIQYLFFMGE